MIIAPLGDSALTITVGDRISPDALQRVHALTASLRSAGLPALQDVVPAYTSVAVFYDPLHLDYSDLARVIRGQWSDTNALAPDLRPRSVTIPVTYDGPDLPAVAEATGLAVEEVIARHSDRWYDVYFLGFVPGFAYLGPLDPTLVLPRRDTPRPRVPAGSVAIGGAQTAVYPLVTPGGWHLLGRTEVPLFDPASDEPARLAAGDRVRFQPT